MPQSNIGASKATSFESYLKDEFERIVQNEPGVLTNDYQEIKIANITFAFNNQKLLNLLRQRGTALTNANKKALVIIDDKINTLKETQLDDLIKPVSAFITFETQEGYERACNIRAKKSIIGTVTTERRFLGAPFYFKEAVEPTNIIWENRHISSFK